MNKTQLDFNLTVSRLIGEIQQLGTMITLCTEMIVEVEFRPHVKWTTVRIYKDDESFKKKIDGVESGFIYVSTEEKYFNDTPEKQQFTIKRLMKIKRQLINILKEKQINYGKLDYTIKTVEYKQYVI
ncbi:hypothetical protein P9E76_01720 [Schinkia azotoformans]|uniref:Uncharacterized protein n=1 Tax=Schinkia azotoformans LMG 9581 TaxID=1131731 RepID=K6D5N9_SCHAZ|nr:hypothetical protein [Schinkia azotoformans]EKN67842.1 hypothetical protein BAZO_08169 [Schinkia azotoformans LMG 9581]MEC1637392.1 hypothetical protein [Schinkia azotoformans]MEC1943796.1 hypothetical protein [Schinkia azotoformans]